MATGGWHPPVVDWQCPGRRGLFRGRPHAAHGTASGYGCGTVGPAALTALIWLPDTVAAPCGRAAARAGSPFDADDTGRRVRLCRAHSDATRPRPPFGDLPGHRGRKYPEVLAVRAIGTLGTRGAVLSPWSERRRAAPRRILRVQLVRGPAHPGSGKPAAEGTPVGNNGSRPGQRLGPGQQPGQHRTARTGRRRRALPISTAHAGGGFSGSKRIAGMNRARTSAGRRAGSRTSAAGGPEQARRLRRRRLPQATQSPKARRRDRQGPKFPSAARNIHGQRRPERGREGGEPARPGHGDRPTPGDRPVGRAKEQRLTILSDRWNATGSAQRGRP